MSTQARGLQNFISDLRNAKSKVSGRDGVRMQHKRNTRSECVGRLLWIEEIDYVGNVDVVENILTQFNPTDLYASTNCDSHHKIRLPKPILSTTVLMI